MRGVARWPAFIRQITVRSVRISALQIAAIAAGYFGVAQIGFFQRIETGNIYLVWPPIGLALAALVLWGVRVWPGIMIGALLVNLASGRSVLFAFLMSLAPTIGVTGAALILRARQFRPDVIRLRDLLWLVVAGAGVGALLISMLAIGSRAFLGLETSGSVLIRWLLTWISEAMSVLVVTPFILVVARIRRPFRIRPAQLVEAVALVAATLVVGFLAITSSTELLFLVFPVLIWAAVRYRLPGAAPTVLMTTAIIIYGAVGVSGPFADGEFYNNLLTIQLLGASSSLTALTLAVTIGERDRAHRDMEQAAVQLAGAVDQLDRRLRPRPHIELHAPDERSGDRPHDT